MSIWKITGVFKGHTRKHPQKIPVWTQGITPEYAKSKAMGRLGTAIRIYKPLKVKKVPPGGTFIP